MSLRILTNIWNFFEDKRKCLKEYMTDCNVREVIERTEEFGKNKLVLIYDSDEYVQENKNKKREFLVIIAKLMAYIHFYKLFFMGSLDDIRIRLLIMDYTLNTFGNRLLYSLSLICIATFFLLLQFLMQYLEINRKLPIFKILHLVKYRIIKYPLNSENYRKFCLYLKISSIYSHNFYLNTSVIILTIFHSFIFGSYPSYGFEIYSMIGQTLGNITFIVTFYYSYAYFCE